MRWRSQSETKAFYAWRTACTSGCIAPASAVALTGGWGAREGKDARTLFLTALGLLLESRLCVCMYSVYICSFFIPYPHAFIYIANSFARARAGQTGQALATFYTWKKRYWWRSVHLMPSVLYVCVCVWGLQIGCGILYLRKN